MTITAYPLAWPAGWKRSGAQSHGKFRTGKGGYRDGSGWQSAKELTIDQATRRVRDELGRMGLRNDDVVISTNLKLRLDGYPRSDQRAPDDTGVAVYWVDKGGATRCMAIDRYYKVADNLAAIAATLDAMRAIERHGGAEILDRAFTGFTALPPPGAPTWLTVLGVSEDALVTDVNAAYKRLRAAAHPDRGGEPGEFQRIQDAWAEFLAARGIHE